MSKSRGSRDSYTDVVLKLPSATKMERDWFRDQAAAHREEIKALRQEISSFVDRMRDSHIGRLVVTEPEVRVAGVKRS